MTDIYDMRVSGDTLSHLLLLTSEPGAVLLDRPSFLGELTDIFFNPYLLTLYFADIPICD